MAVSGTNVFISHGDENLDTSTMGMIAALDGSATGDIKTTKWNVKGTEFGFSSPVIDGQRLYQLDNSAVLHAYELETGRLLFEHQIGTGQKAPLVLADNKLYVGTENGRFFTLRLRPDRVEVVNEVQLPISTNSVGRIRRDARTDRVGRGDLARPRLLRVERCGVRDWTEGAESADRHGGG